MASNDGKKVLKELLRELERQGFGYVMTKNGHIRIYNPAGKPVYTLPGSPGEGRALKNMISGLRRCGFVWKDR